MGTCRRRLASVITAVGVAGLGLLSGCGSELTYVPVQGKVALKDGTPVGAGYVAFFPDKDNKLQVIPRAKLNADGSYVMDTIDESGVPLGWYIVGVRSGVGGPDDPPAPFSSKYFGHDSPLRVEVVASPAPGAYDFVLDPAKSKGVDRAH